MEKCKALTESSVRGLNKTCMLLKQCVGEYTCCLIHLSKQLVSSATVATSSHSMVVALCILPS